MVQNGRYCRLHGAALEYVLVTHDGHRRVRAMGFGLGRCSSTSEKFFDIIVSSEYLASRSGHCDAQDLSLSRSLALCFLGQKRTVQLFGEYQHKKNKLSFSFRGCGSISFWSCSAIAVPLDTQFDSRFRPVKVVART